MPRQQHLSLLEIVNKVHEPSSLTQSLSISVLRQQSMHPTIDILICNHLRDGPGFTEQVCKYLYSIPSLLAILRDRDVKISKKVEPKDTNKHHHSSMKSIITVSAPARHASAVSSLCARPDRELWPHNPHLVQTPELQLLTATKMSLHAMDDILLVWMHVTLKLHNECIIT